MPTLSGPGGGPQRIEVLLHGPLVVLHQHARFPASQLEAQRVVYLLLRVHRSSRELLVRVPHERLAAQQPRGLDA